MKIAVLLWIKEFISLILRLLLFKVFVRHKQNGRNILLFCSRRGGSTWVMNSMSNSPGLRYVGKPLIMLQFTTLYFKLHSYIRSQLSTQCDLNYVPFVSLPDKYHLIFDHYISKIFNAEVNIYPSINFFGHYFQRSTSRVVFQITNGISLYDYFKDDPRYISIVLFRNPITTSLSIISRGWKPEYACYLSNSDFMHKYFTSDQRKLAHEYSQDNNSLFLHVLDWCLKFKPSYLNYVDSIENIDGFYFYEQLRDDPSKYFNDLCKFVDLDFESVVKNISQPSRSSKLSNNEIRRSSFYSVPEKERIRMMSMVHSLGYDIYNFDNEYPFQDDK